MRLQLALNVPDIEAAVDYYGKLFDVEVHKRRPGYANFVVNDPPLKLVLFENADGEQLNHIGVETLQPGEVKSAEARLQSAGILQNAAADTICCHAEQEKLWTEPHNGLSWEWYRVLDEMPQGAENSSKGCCA